MSLHFVHLNKECESSLLKRNNVYQFWTTARVLEDCNSFLRIVRYYIPSEDMKLTMENKWFALFLRAPGLHMAQNR